MQVKAFTTKRPRIEMVPLIDMFFLLLVFFIFGVFSLSMRQGIVVDLPSAKTASPDSKEETVVLSVTADGGIVAEQTTLTLESLGQWLTEKQATTPIATVAINADRAAKHGLVIAVLDAVRQAGIQRVSFQIEPSHEP